MSVYVGKVDRAPIFITQCLRRQKESEEISSRRSSDSCGKLGVRLRADKKMKRVQVLSGRLLASAFSPRAALAWSNLLASRCRTRYFLTPWPNITRSYIQHSGLIPLIPCSPSSAFSPTPPPPPSALPPLGAVVAPPLSLASPGL